MRLKFTLMGTCFRISAQKLIEESAKGQIDFSSLGHESVTEALSCVLCGRKRNHVCASLVGNQNLSNSLFVRFPAKV